MTDHSHENHGAGGGAGRWVFWGFVLIAAFFLITEHRAHVFQYWPFLLLLACPLMHLFHGHGRHGEDHRNQTDAAAGKADSQKKPSGCH